MSCLLSFSSKLLFLQNMLVKTCRLLLGWNVKYQDSVQWKVLWCKLCECRRWSLCSAISFGTNALQCCESKYPYKICFVMNSVEIVSNEFLTLCIFFIAEPSSLSQDEVQCYSGQRGFFGTQKFSVSSFYRLSQGCTLLRGVEALPAGLGLLSEMGTAFGERFYVFHSCCHHSRAVGLSSSPPA